MFSLSVVDAGLPDPGDDPLRRLTAQVAELEALSRFTVEGIAERAERVAAEAEAEGPELTEVRLRARLVGADMARCRGEHAEAGRSAQAISRWAVENERPFLRARSAYVLASIFQELGDSATALEHAIEAVDLLDDDAPAELRIDHSLRLADTLGQHGDASASLRYADVLALTHERGDARRELVVLNNWAYIETLLGRFDEALPIAQQLEARSADFGETLGVGRLDTLGRVLIGLGRLEDAEAVLLPGLAPELLDSSTDGDAGADFLLTLAEVRRRLGDLHGARQVLDDCVARCERHGLTAIRVRARQEQAELHAAQGDHRAAFTEHKLFHEQLVELQSAQRDARARAVQAMYETSEARRQSRRYRELSLRDPLTGLYNRRHIDEQLIRLLGPGGCPRPRRAWRWSTSITSSGSTTRSATTSATPCCAGWPDCSRRPCPPTAPGPWAGPSPPGWAARSSSSSWSTPHPRTPPPWPRSCGRRSPGTRGRTSPARCRSPPASASQELPTRPRRRCSDAPTRCSTAPRRRGATASSPTPDRSTRSAVGAISPSGQAASRCRT